MMNLSSIIENSIKISSVVCVSCQHSASTKNDGIDTLAETRLMPGETTIIRNRKILLADQIRRYEPSKRSRHTSILYISISIPISTCTTNKIHRLQRNNYIGRRYFPLLCYSNNIFSSRKPI